MKEYLFSQYAAETFPILEDSNYFEEMDRKVEPLLKSLCQSYHLKLNGSDQKLYAELYRNPESQDLGTIFISHGFTESSAKFHEAIYYMLQSGYHVAVMDHRGHGFSRADESEDFFEKPTDVEAFQCYIDDMHAVIRNIVTPSLPGPYYLYAHSMGGCIGATYLEQHPDIFAKAVLTAPMCEIQRGGIPKLGTKLLFKIVYRHGKQAKFMITQGKYSDEADFENSCGNSEVRYLYYYKKQQETPEYRNSGSSFRWTRESLYAGEKLLKPANCKRVKIPVLLFQAEKDTLVTPEAQEKFIKRIENGTLVLVEGMKHELYMSGGDMASRYWGTIFAFLRD